MTDQRYLDVTLDEMMADYFAHTYDNDPKAAEEVIDEDFDADDVASLIGADVLANNDDWEDLN